MIQNEKARIWVNRVFAFLGGALVIYAVMSLAVVRNVKDENTALKTELYGADRLLTNAKGFFENGDYTATKKTLDTLFEKHPGATQMTEGKQLYAEMESAQNALDRRWDAAVGAIREQWTTTMAAELRAKSEKDRETMEQNMIDVLNAEWDKIKGDLRREWEKKT